MVTVVDAANLLKDYGSQDFLRDRGETMGPQDERALVDLLVDQIEFADVIILNKMSTASPGERDAARRIIKALNPVAKLIETDFCDVPLDEILDTGLFSLEAAEQNPMWFKELNGFKDHVPETEEYGIRSFVYRQRRPFNPLLLDRLLKKTWPGVVRAKGFFWLATRPSLVGELSQAGALVRTMRRGTWWAAVPRNRWPDHPEWLASMKPYLDPSWGDRRQEIVFIGTDPMDEAAMRRELDACLVPASGFTPENWTRLPDPFPAW